MLAIIAVNIRNTLLSARIRKDPDPPWSFSRKSLTFVYDYNRSLYVYCQTPKIQISFGCKHQWVKIESSGNSQTFSFFQSTKQFHSPKVVSFHTHVKCIFFFLGYGKNVRSEQSKRQILKKRGLEKLAFNNFYAVVKSTAATFFELLSVAEYFDFFRLKDWLLKSLLQLFVKLKEFSFTKLDFTALLVWVKKLYGLAWIKYSVPHIWWLFTRWCAINSRESPTAFSYISEKGCECACRSDSGHKLVLPETSGQGWDT